MGGVAEGGVGIVDKTSPRRSAIDKVQAELRQEHDFREKRKRELDFLENGGDPLEYLKDRNTLSLSVQSTSFTGQHPDQFVSEAKGSFALAASPHGDSVESSGRLGTNTCDPNSADNLMLFEAEHTFSEGDRNSSQPRNDPVPSEKFSLVDRRQRTQERGDSAAFCVPRKAYKRRNRSRPNRDGTRSSSTNVNLTCGSHGSLPPSNVPMEFKDLASDAENQNVSSNCNNKLTTPVDNTHQNITLTESKKDLESADRKAVESKANMIGFPVDTASGGLASDAALDDKCNQQSASGDVEILNQIESDACTTIRGMEEITSSVIKCQASAAAVEVENLPSSCHMDGLSNKKGEDMIIDALNCSDLDVTKGLDSTSSCTQAGLVCDGRITSEMLNEITNADSDGKIIDQTSVPDGTIVVEVDKFLQEKKETKVVDSSCPVNLESGCISKSQGENVFKILSEEAVSHIEPALKNEVKSQVAGERGEPIEPPGAESGRNSPGLSGDKHVFHNENENSFNAGTQASTNTPTTGVSDDVLVSPVAPKSSGSDTRLTKEVEDDSILKAAQLIEAKRKRIMEFSIIPTPKQIRLKSHWDYVIEEMEWLANDFAQERAWKRAAAALVSSQASFKYQSRLQEKSSGVVAKKAARSLAKSIVEYWQSVEETSKVDDLKSQDKDGAHSLQAYAMRFLKYNNCVATQSEPEVPSTPDGLIDMGISNLSSENNLTEENLFYTVPAGAMLSYINSIEGHVSQRERIGSSIQEEVDEMSICDAIADFECQDEDDGETSTYYTVAAFERSNSSRNVQKNRKHLAHAYNMQTNDVGSNTTSMQYAENKFLTQQSTLLVKRPGGSLNVSIPTKRVRTASRRIISPFNAGPSGFVQVPTKADASSGDTNSFQDDQLYGGSLVPNSLEAESFGNFENQYPYDSAEVSTKHKKKKKAKHLVDSTFYNDQANKDHLRKSYQLDSNGSNGLLTQTLIKRPKSMRQSLDNSFENITPVSGSVPSPVASQMSNMSNPNKFIKIFGSRDRGRKSKILKMPPGQPSSGSPWTLFEDQALVVLAHDMGPNWELVSDALNSTMYFKCTCRKPKECKERHNFLMDRTSGDGADSAEDSGSSQPYPYTLPGIPKGSARQLFQRLHGPIEEETIKSHFEKIIIIEQKKHYRKTQDPKQLQTPHGSHAIALSQALQNNLDGRILTPLDLCDAIISGADIPSTGYQGQHSGGLTNSNQATAAQPHPASGASSVLQGPPNMIGNSFSSMPGTLNTSARGGRYVVPRSASLSADEQQRMHQYNQMMSGRNASQLSSPGAVQGTDRGVRLLPGGSGMGLVCGVNRSMPMIRPGLQGMGSSSLGNCGNMVSSSMASASVNSGVGSGQGSTMLRPRETLNVMQPAVSLESPQQIMVPDLQMQVSPRSHQGISHFGGLSSTFPNQSSPVVTSYTLHHQPSHPMSPQNPQVLTRDSHIPVLGNHTPNPQQQSYSVHMAKERQQHHFLQQQQQLQLQPPQFTASGSIMSPVKSQSQHPVSSITQGPRSPMTPTTSLSSMTQHQQKQPTSSQGVVRSTQTGGLSNQTSKQRQRQLQQFSQVNRQHPLQRQQQQAQLPSKVTKGVGRGNVIMHQSIPIDPVAENGISKSPGNQYVEKGEAATQLTQSHGLHSGSTLLNAVQPTKKFVSPQSSHQPMSKQKAYSGQTASTVKQINQQTSQLDNSNQNHALAVAPGLSAGDQSAATMAVATASSHQKVPLPTQEKPENASKTSLQRVSQTNQIDSASLTKPQARDHDTDKQSLNISTEVDKLTSLHIITSTATDVVQVPQAAPCQWEASEPSLDPHTPNSVVDCSLLSVSSSASESTQSRQGIGLRQSSASLTSTRLDGKAQWQSQPSKLRRPNTPVPQPQQHEQPVHTQHQVQLLQSGNDNLYGRAGENRLE